jgi:hypothetical protein
MFQRGELLQSWWPSAIWELLLGSEVREALRALAVPEQLLHVYGFNILRRRHEGYATLAVERELAGQNALSVRVHSLRQPLLRRRPGSQTVAAALDVRLHIRLHAMPEHVETDECGQDFERAAMAMGAVEVLEQRQPEHRERITAVEGHDAAVGHVGHSVPRDARDGWYQRS